MSDSDYDQESQVPPGPGPSGQFNLIKRRPEPLWIIALVIVSPLIVVLVLFLLKTLL